MPFRLLRRLDIHMVIDGHRRMVRARRPATRHDGIAAGLDDLCFGPRHLWICFAMVAMRRMSALDGSMLIDGISTIWPMLDGLTMFDVRSSTDSPTC